MTGCGEKQPQVQKPQQPLTETDIAVAVKEVPSKKQATQLYPVKHEKQTRTPDWVKEIISIYDNNYGSWSEKSSADTSSSILIASLTSSGVTSTTPSTPVSISTSPQPPASIPGVERPSSIVRGPGSSTPVSPPSVSASAVSTPSTIPPAVEPGKPDSGGDTTPQPPQPPVQSAGVDVIRTIQNTTEGAYIRLNVNVKDTKVNGIIVTENLPDNYTLVNASPTVSKRTGNSIKWLFYGTSLTGQTINYEIKGTGRATISGSFSSTLGSGNTTGDAQLGQ